jgi:LPS O-antigen subunit length determinant protein (WzzB/FepE family)
MHQTPALAALAPRNLIRQTLKSLKLIVSAGVIGALAGALVSHFVHPRWVASMTVQVGQIMTVSGGRLESRPIENPLTVIDRFNLPAFRIRIIKDMGLPSPDSARESREIFDSLNALPETSPDLIHLQVTAYSREQAEAILRSAFGELSAAHRPLYDPAVDNMKSALASTSTKLVAAEADYARGYQALRSSAEQGNAALDNTRSILITNMATQINLQVIQLKQQAEQLQQALNPMNTYPTRVIEAPYAPLKPRSPSMTLLIAAGAVLGLLAGAALALSANSKRG